MICRVVGFVALALSCSAANSQSQWITTLMAGMPEHHCSEAQGTEDGKAFVCTVWDNDPQKFSAPRQLEVYRNRQPIVTIEPGTPIREWHFWNRGEQLSIHTGVQGDVGTYQLYETATGKLVDQVSQPSSPSKLPQWAKDRSQLDEESVPEGAAYSQQRAQWIANVLRQITSIHPGMTRRDLESTFTTEGGLSWREQQTFAYKDCRYIKVDVVFSGTGATEAEDKIVRISKPYLAWTVMD
jgi:hypothetical protein